jgi:hypothetical protein
MGELREGDKGYEERGVMDEDTKQMISMKYIMAASFHIPPKSP